MAKEEKAKRAAIAKQFRDELKAHGLKNAIVGLIGSNNDKTSVRKQVLTQQCRKPNFRRDFTSACKEIGSYNPMVWALYHEIINS